MKKSKIIAIASTITALSIGPHTSAISQSLLEKKPIQSTGINNLIHQLIGNLSQKNDSNESSSAPPFFDAKNLTQPTDLPPRAGGLIVKPSRVFLSNINSGIEAQLKEIITSALGIEVSEVFKISNNRYSLRFSKTYDYEVVSQKITESANLEDRLEITIDLVASTSAVSHDPGFGNQHGLMGSTDGFPAGIDATTAWNITTGSSGTVLAVVDTGVLPHPDFIDRLLPGYDFVQNVNNAGDGDGRDNDATDPGDHTTANQCHEGSTAQNSTWHGTHVTGIAAADGANGIGIAGVSWRTKILPVRVLGKCGGLTSDIIDGIRWAAGLQVPGVPTNPNPAHIINLSLGGYQPNGCDRPTQEAINEAIGQGAVVVVAAGNYSQNAKMYTPANCEGVLTVMATDPFGELASYSNYSFSGDVSAPGGDLNRYGSIGGIYSTVGSGTTTRGVPSYGYKHGTSMASPHVSGSAALALAANPRLTGGELAYLLKFMSNDFPSGTYCKSFKICGDGIVDSASTVAGAIALSKFQLVYEFYNEDLDHYFRTGNKGDAAIINKGGAGPGWFDTLDYFYAWSSSQGGALPVCRFYGTPGIGPNSHFYTADPAECAQVKLDRGWTYEGVAFFAMLPSATGLCPSGTTPIYRAYNNRWMFNDSNHKYTARYSDYVEIVAKGWNAEGVRLCVAAG